MPNKEYISKKYNNYNYAPGIATYGIDGKVGETGEDGVNIYYTDYVGLRDAGPSGYDNLVKIISKIVNGYLPINGADIKINRPYKEGDMFFGRDGLIHKLKNLDLIKLSELSDIGSYDMYFTLSGQIIYDDQSKYFEFANNTDRMVLNTSSYNGFDIISLVKYNDVSLYLNENAAVNVLSANIDENDNILLVNLCGIDSEDIEDGNLNLYYKTTDNAFYVDSNKPIIISGCVQLKNNANTDYNNFAGIDDKYSPVLTSNDPISYFKYMCDQLAYSVIYDNESNQYVLNIFQSMKNGQLHFYKNLTPLEYISTRSDAIFGKIYTANNEQILIRLDNGITTDASVGLTHYYDLLGPIDSFVDNASINNIHTCDNIYVINDDASTMLNWSTNNIYLSINVEFDIKGYTDRSIQAVNAIKYNYLNVDIFQKVEEKKYEYKKGDETNNDEIREHSNYIKVVNHSVYSKKTSLYNQQNSVTETHTFVFDSNLYCINAENEKYVKLTFNIGANDIMGLESLASFDLNIKNLKSGLYVMYFDLIYQNDISKPFVISNIKLFDRLLNIGKTVAKRNSISTYIPENVDSIVKFSLIGNTEVFIKYSIPTT